MNRLSSLLSLALLSLLVGCASGPKYPEAVSTFPQLAASQGRIVFYRNGVPVGMAVQPDVKLNNDVVGRSVPNQFFYVDRPAGNYVVSCST